MILLDTNGLVAAYDRGDRHHHGVVRVLSRPHRRMLSPFVLAELDYLITKRVSDRVARHILSDVARGAYELALFEPSDIARAAFFIDRYDGFDIGLIDTSIVVLAERYQCNDILPLDQRHSCAVSVRADTPLRLLPFDD